jgi:hypothetical protein
VEIADIDNRGKISLVLVSEDEENNSAASPESTPVDATTGS